MTQAADISILLPLNYTIWLLRLETPQRQPRKPMIIWLTPNRSSRIPTISRPENTDKWIVLCFVSLSRKCRSYGFLPLAVVLFMVGGFKPLGSTQDSLENHCRSKDSFLILNLSNANSQLELLLPGELQMRGPWERACIDTNMQYMAPRTVSTLRSEEKNIPVLLLKHALFLAAKDAVVAGTTSRPAPTIPGNHHSKQEMGFWKNRPSSTLLTIRGIALRTTPNRSRANRLNPLQDVHPSQQVMVTFWFD